MKILTYLTHESFQWSLAKTGHEFYNMPSKNRPEGWNDGVRPRPANMHLISLEDAQARHAEFDLLLTQSDMQWGVSQWWQGKRLHIEHTAYPYPVQPYWDCPSVFITEFNRRMWSGGPVGNAVSVIRHGIDPNEWKPYSGHISEVLTVVQNFRKRDWYAGYSLFNWVVRDLPHQIFGHGNEDVAKHAKCRLPVRGSDSWAETQEWYSSYRTYFNSTLYSPMPMAVLEAMAAGMSVVTNVEGECPYYIQDGVNGFISDDPDHLTNSMARLLNDGDYARAMGLKAKESVFELCGIDRFVNEWNEVLAGV